MHSVILPYSTFSVGKNLTAKSAKSGLNNRSTTAPLPQAVNWWEFLLSKNIFTWRKKTERRPSRYSIILPMNFVQKGLTNINKHVAILNKDVTFYW